VTLLPLLPYILVLHWLIYRLHKRQKAHEAVILAAVGLIGQMTQKVHEAQEVSIEEAH